MVIKLNDKQKEIVIDFVNGDSCGYELYKFFYTTNKREIMAMDIEINDNVTFPYGADSNGWWNLVVDSEIVTQLNFHYYPKVLKQIQKLA